MGCPWRFTVAASQVENSRRTLRISVGRSNVCMGPAYLSGFQATRRFCISKRGHFLNDFDKDREFAFSSIAHLEWDSARIGQRRRIETSTQSLPYCHHQPSPIWQEDCAIVAFAAHLL